MHHGGYAQHGQQHDGHQQQQGLFGDGQPPQAPQQQLPYPWEMLVDQSSGHAYYSNPQTGETSWEPPQQHGDYDAQQHGAGYPQHGPY